MAAEMPARVEAVPDAVVVEFPWAAAATAVDALNGEAARLGSQLETRAGMVGAIVEWAGRFRDDYDAAHGRLTKAAGGLKETLTTTASSIVSGAEAANHQQRVNNDRALNPQPVGAGGRNIPI